MVRKIRKGDRIETTGRGKTKSWGKYKGTVEKRRGNQVFVRWDNTSFSDQMSMTEIRRQKSKRR